MIASLLWNAPLVAGNYSYTRIAITGGEFSGLGIYPAINNLGQVAFGAQLSAGGSSVNRGDGAHNDVIATTGGQFTNVYNADPNINDLGQVVFSANAGGQTGLYLGDGGAIATVNANVSVLGKGINNDGVVHYVQSRLPFPFTNYRNDYYRWDNGVTTNVASFQSPSQLGEASWPMEDSGFALFYGATSPARLLRFQGAASTDLVSTFGLSRAGVGSINSSGLVVFGGEDSTSTVQSLYLSNGASLATVADTSGPLSSFLYPSINDLGQIAFYALGDTPSMTGIYTGPDVVAHRVVGVGDSLDGSTINSLFSYMNSLNDAGQIAFYAALADGRKGVYRATLVPEPSTFALGLATLLAIGALCAWKRI